MNETVIKCMICNKPISQCPLGEIEDVDETPYWEFMEHVCAFCGGTTMIAIAKDGKDIQRWRVHAPHPNLVWRTSIY